MRTIIIIVFVLLLRQFGFTQTEKCGLDTVFCDIQNTSYIILAEEVTLVDVGNPDQYAAQIKGNLVFIKPTKKDVPPTTILIKSGMAIFHGTLVYNKTGKTKPYYYEIKSAAETNTAKKEITNSDAKNKSGKENPPAEVTLADTSLKSKVESFRKIKSEIKTLGFLSPHVDAAVTVIRNDENNTYLKLLVNNKSSLPFKLDFISFQYYQDMKKGTFRKSRKAPIDVFPVEEPAIKEIAPGKSEALPYVIPAYALSNNGYLMVLVRESAGDRILKIKIDGSVIQGSQQLIVEKKNK
jgi:Domain of unknown function (DUF4138)